MKKRLLSILIVALMALAASSAFANAPGFHAAPPSASCVGYFFSNYRGNIDVLWLKNLVKEEGPEFKNFGDFLSSFAPLRGPC